MHQPPTHGAIPLADLQKLLAYFRQTPMPHDVSDPFVRALGAAVLLALDADTHRDMGTGTRQDGA